MGHPGLPSPCCWTPRSTRSVERHLPAGHHGNAAPVEEKNIDKSPVLPGLFPASRGNTSGVKGLTPAPWVASSSCPQLPWDEFLPHWSPPRTHLRVHKAKHGGIPEHPSLPGAESLGASGTQAPAPTRQMASLSPCDLIWFLFLIFGCYFGPQPPLPPFPLPCPSATFSREERADVVSTRFLHFSASLQPLVTSLEDITGW